MGEKLVMWFVSPSPSLNYSVPLYKFGFFQTLVSSPNEIESSDSTWAEGRRTGGPNRRTTIPTAGKRRNTTTAFTGSTFFPLLSVCHARVPLTETQTPRAL